MGRWSDRSAFTERYSEKETDEMAAKTMESRTRLTGCGIKAGIHIRQRKNATMKFVSTARRLDTWLEDLPYGLQSVAFGAIATITYSTAKFFFASIGVHFEGTLTSGLFAGLGVAITHFTLSLRDMA